MNSQFFFARLEGLKPNLASRVEKYQENLKMTRNGNKLYRIPRCRFEKHANDELTRLTKLLGHIIDKATPACLSSSLKKTNLELKR